MNLHSLAFPLRNVALWLTAVGGNGRSIGNHLWPIEEGEPPEFNTVGRRVGNTTYWTPVRFSWRPFMFSGLFARGFVPPLCGRRSQAQHPRIQEGWSNEQCLACAAQATLRGMMPLTYAQARERSVIKQALDVEQAAWVAAGRPPEWPLQSPEN